LLSKFNSKNNLEAKIYDLLSRNNGVYPNEIINAIKLGLSLVNDNKNIALLAPMQSGKTGSIKHLCNLILPEINFLKENESVMFLTSMRDSDLYEQNIRALESDLSNIIVVKMDDFKSTGMIEIDRNNVKLIIRDEDQYGCGTDSTFDNGFFHNIRLVNDSIPLISVSATPYDVIDANNKGYDLDLIKGVRSNNYFGITEMLKEGLIRNIENNYQHFITNEDDVSYLSEEIKDCILHLNKFENGIGVIRTSKTSEAVELKSQLNFVNNDFETIIIGCKSECDYNIKEGLRILPRMIKNQNKKVIVLVIHALTAGKDLKSLKDHVRFVIETRKTQLANCAQGLPGRVCGYHSNRDIKIYANEQILEYFSQFELNPEIMFDNVWMSGLRMDEKVGALTTHTRLDLFHKSGDFTDIDHTFKLNYDQILSDKGKELLDFLGNDQYETLIKLFTPSVYEDGEFVKGIHNENFHLTVASRNKKESKIYAYLEKDKGDNFRFFSQGKGSWKYGIVVANYPLGHTKNKIDFCGIKVFKSGKTYWKETTSSTVNYSQYYKEEEFA
jgi:hypothetical protein